MIDKDKLKEMLEIDTRIIKPNETITLEIKDLLLQYPKTKRNTVFLPIAKSGKGEYNVEYICPNCGKPFFHRSTKQDIFKNKKCDVCEAIDKKEREERERLAQEDMANRYTNETNEFIETFLSINHSWKEGVSTNVIRHSLENHLVFRDIIREYINQMPYHEFLQTPYWKGVAKLVKARAKYRCELCGSGGRLNIHHKTYENHGDEIHHLKDLICLCENCHQKFHDKLAE